MQHWSEHKNSCSEQPRSELVFPEPLLSLNAFEVFVRLVYLLPRESLHIRDVSFVLIVLLSIQILFAARLVFPLLIIQILVAIAQKDYQTSSSMESVFQLSDLFKQICLLLRKSDTPEIVVTGMLLFIVNFCKILLVV